MRYRIYHCCSRWIGDEEKQQKDVQRRPEEESIVKCSEERFQWFFVRELLSFGTNAIVLAMFGNEYISDESERERGRHTQRERTVRICLAIVVVVVFPSIILFLLLFLYVLCYFWFSFFFLPSVFFSCECMSVIFFFVIWTVNRYFLS